MTTRSLSFLFLLAFVCFSAIDVIIVVEGRLFAPMNDVVATSSNDESSSDESESSEITAAYISTDIAASKFNSFVEQSSAKELSSGSTMCDHIHPDELPEECTCREPGPLSLVIECLKTFNSTYFNDTIGMKIDLDPCNEDGAKLSLDVTEMDHDIDFPIVGINAGESKNIPIPGLAMIVPGVGNVGIDVAVLIAGNPDMLRLKIGLNACAQLSTDHQLCASSIPGVSNILPWYILKGTYSFGDICGSNKHHVGADISNNNNNIEERGMPILLE